MKRINRWVLAATLTFCGAMMMLTSCTDAIGTADNPVNPNPPYDPAGELAQETFINEPWMDRSVKPGDSFWDFALGSWLKNHDKQDDGTMMNAYGNQVEKLLNGLLESASDHHTIQLVTSTKLTLEEEKAAMLRMYAQLKQGDDISKADVMYNIGKMADMGFCVAKAKAHFRRMAGHRHQYTGRRPVVLEYLRYRGVDNKIYSGMEGGGTRSHPHRLWKA